MCLDGSLRLIGCAESRVPQVVAAWPFGASETRGRPGGSVAAFTGNQMALEAGCLAEAPLWVSTEEMPLARLLFRL